MRIKSNFQNFLCFPIYQLKINSEPKIGISDVNIKVVHQKLDPLKLKK